MYQFCKSWYYEYHFFEYLVPTLFFEKDKKLNVLVIGGGDLIGTSMLLKYANIKNIEVIDIDEKMIKYAENELKTFDFIKGPFYKDKRLHINIGDAFVKVNGFIAKNKKFDLVIYDLPVIDNHKLLPLLSIEFLQKLQRLTKKNGYLSIYQEIGGEGFEPIVKQANLFACAGFKKMLYMEGFKIKPSPYIDYEDRFLYFTVNGDFKVRQNGLLNKMLLENKYLHIEARYVFFLGELYDAPCPTSFSHKN